MGNLEQSGGNRQLVTSTFQNELSAVQQQNLSARLIQAKFNQLPEETQQALAKFAAEKQIEFESKVNNDKLTHISAQADLDRYVNFEHDLSHTGESRKYHKSSIDVKTVTGSIHAESKSSNCYVATATYDNKYHPNVVILRDFRDRFLRRSREGKCFIFLYYLIGPYLAYFPRHSKFIKCLSKKMLDGIVMVIVKQYYFN